jgi:hypothetical protein
MILNLGSFQIDLSSPKTAFFMVAILFFLMVISAYCGQTEKKFIRTNSGRLTTKQPTQKIRAKKKVVSQTSSLLPKKVQKKLLKNSKKLKKKGDKTLKVAKKAAKKGSFMTESYGSDYSDDYSNSSDYDY